MKYCGFGLKCGDYNFDMLLGLEQFAITRLKRYLDSWKYQSGSQHTKFGWREDIDDTSNFLQVKFQTVCSI